MTEHEIALFKELIETVVDLNVAPYGYVIELEDRATRYINSIEAEKAARVPHAGEVS